MTRKLESLFDLPPSAAEADTAVPSIETSRLALAELDDNIDKINTALPAVRGLESSDKKKLYFLGIIDVLTSFNLKKKCENLYKSIRYDSQTISCVPPE